jgi:hypothetical protein
MLVSSQIFISKEFRFQNSFEVDVAFLSLSSWRHMLDPDRANISMYMVIGDTLKYNFTDNFWGPGRREKVFCGKNLHRIL